MILNVFHGFCMALADSVPGVSGGTVAYILGFYERFINALHDLFGGTVQERKCALFYLCKLGLGWAAGLISSMLILAQLFEQNIYFLTSLFLGLTLAAIPFIVIAEKKILRKHERNIPFLILGLMIVCGLTAFRASSVSSGAVDYLHLMPLQYVYLFLSGVFAIMAMVLPGVSGSTLLLIMGVYIPTVNAVHSFLHLELAVMPGLIALAMGILAGAVLAVHFVSRALKNHRGQMVYLILGLMSGSLAAIIMGPTTLDLPQPPLDLNSFQPLGFVLGIVILFGMEFLRRMTTTQTSDSEDATHSASGPSKKICDED